MTRVTTTTTTTMMMMTMMMIIITTMITTVMRRLDAGIHMRGGRNGPNALESKEGGKMDGENRGAAAAPNLKRQSYKQTKSKHGRTAGPVRRGRSASGCLPVDTKLMDKGCDEVVHGERVTEKGETSPVKAPSPAAA